jgi:hypothetical protein
MLPLILGSALVPIQIIIVILLLTSPKQGTLKATAFVAGNLTMRLAQGVVFGFLLTGGSDADESAATSGWVVPLLLLVLGILLLISAYRQWVKEPDLDAPPPKWLTMTSSLTPLTAYAMGAGMVLVAAKMWVFTLGAISAIGEAQLGQPTSSITYLIFCVLCLSLSMSAILVTVIAPQKSTAWLAATNQWLTDNNRVIVIVVSLIFGSFFLYNGITGLLS